MNLDLGTILGAIAIILFLADKTFKKEREVDNIKSQMEKILEKCDEYLNQAKEIIKNSKELAISHHLRPELSIFVTKQWEFVEKTFHNRFEKHSICRRIVMNFINSDTNILLDSGSTVDLITFELLTSDKSNINVLSNNVFAAMHLIGERRISFRLLSGLFNDRYAATYSDEAISQIQLQDFSIIILAATAINFRSGIMVYKGDEENLKFKKTALNKFRKSMGTKLIIAVDATKFTNSEEKDICTEVLPENEWTSLRDRLSSRIIIVTSHMRPETDVSKRAEFDREIESFKAVGIAIDLG